MAGFFFELHKTLGLFIPLFVVNCIILGRAEAFASRHRLAPSVLDGVGMGLGFGLALVLIAFIREVLGAGRLWDITISSLYTSEGAVEPAAVMVMAPGAFVVIGLIIGYTNWRKSRRLEKLRMERM